MLDKKSSYRQIFKATSIFGGVQVITILIGILKTKFVAVWLGVTGVGIMGLLNASLAFMTTLTGLGLALSAIQEISEAAGSGDELRVSRSIKTSQRWFLFTGLLGMLLTLSLAPLLSELSFGNTKYTGAFVLLSVTLLLSAITTGQKVLLQGLRSIKHLAQSTIAAAVIGFFVSMPLFYYYGIDGIVPSLFLTSVLSLVINWFYSRKIKLKRVDISYKSSFEDGFNMVKLGLALTVSVLIGALVKYLIAAYISRRGGTEQVGLFQAGFALITGYVGIVFTAMATDYFPRLAATKEIRECNSLINQQIEMALLVMAPICVALTISLPIVIKVLYTVDFLATIPMLEWVLFAVIIKSISWSIGFIFLAKADYLTAFKVDNISNFFFLTGYIALYFILGLQGIGIAEFGLYCLGLILVYYHAHKKYHFRFNRQTIEVISLCLSIAFAVFILLKFLERSFISYTISVALFFVLSFLSIKNLDNRLGIKSLVYKYAKKYYDK